MNKFRGVKLASFSVALLLLVGCSTTGTQALKNETSATISGKIQEGKTTKGDVYAVLGQPTTMSFTDSGLEILTYDYVRYTPMARNFIPYNFFSLGQKGKKKQLVILLDKEGVVQKFEMHESDVETRAGLLE